ncbi:DUF2493 domain-containing protein [Nonomuraea angiospora]|uniref:DUF2493 domain-containing protein n=1 Tax=Nonomuraea angiospora TaxID=46172 RepID=UPI0033CFFEA6
MNGPTLDELEQHCTRCGHQNGVHTRDEKRPRWGWPIYDPIFMNASGACSTPGCTCEAHTNDPAAAPAPPLAFTPPRPWQPQACGQCGTAPARFYITGWACGQCSPAAIAGQPEPQGGSCAPLRHYCPPDTRCATWAWQQQPWRVLATGGRDRTDKARIWSEFDKILVVHPVLTVVHGAAYPRPEHGSRPDKSADWLVHLWCERNGVKEEAHPADWKTCGRAAGLIRNTEMAKLGADECAAFPGAGNGTRHCIAQASAAGIPVRITWPHTPAVAHA